MTTTLTRAFNGGTLVVTDMPSQKCDCDEQIAVVDGALVAGYVRHLVEHHIIGDVTISMNQLQSNYSVADFLKQ